MAITNLDQLVAALAARGSTPLFFPSGTTVSGGFTNLNRLVTGSAQGQMAVPPSRTTGGHVPTDVLTGFPNFPNPGAGNSLYLARVGVNNSVAGGLLLYDRVYAASGFAGNVATAQAITGFPTLPADRVGAGNGLEIWLESYTAIGATASNVTVQYTNTASPTPQSGRNTVSEAIIASMPAGRMQRLRLQDGDLGVTSIESLTLSVSTGTAGDFGVTLLRRLGIVPLPVVSAGALLDAFDVGLPELDDETALQFVHVGTGTATGVLMGALNIVEG